MKLPLRWLEAYVQPNLQPRELADRLTMSGTLVEGVSNSGAQLDQILVARVTDLERHPNADSLWLATIDLGERQQTIVTGAPNLVVGALVPFIPVGQCLPGQSKPLEGKMIRGIRSEGMLCAGDELGLSDDHSGILILNEQIAGRLTEDRKPEGQPLTAFLGEWILELEITPNRPDCLAIFGVAREVAAITGAPLSPHSVTLHEVEPPARDLAAVRIDAPDLCKRLTARVITGVTIGPSPAWLVERLQSAGMRSINNVVDVTNYVMLELGQPLHPYDLDALAGHRLIARRATTGESIVTLDGVERRLGSDQLVIADDMAAVGIAGIMGGGSSEVSPTTTRVLLEAATFQPRQIRRSSVALGLRTEASSRFEKGLPLRLALEGSARAAALIAELAGGVVHAGVVQAGETEPAPRTIEFAVADVARLLGVNWPMDRIVRSLEALGFSVAALDPARILVTVPWWREDVAESADLVEEVARVAGFDAIPETLLAGSVPPRPVSPGQAWTARTRRLLLGSGLNEACSRGLTSRQVLDQLRPPDAGEDWLSLAIPNPTIVREAGATFEPVRLVNPLSPEREFLRISLLPELLEAVRDNLRAGEDRAAFYELDFTVFARPEQLPLERRSLAIAMAGVRQPRGWSSPGDALDFFDLKGLLELLLQRLVIAEWSLARTTHPLLHPGRGAEIRLGETSLGFLGELHPAIAVRWDLGEQRAYIAEIDFDALAAVASEVRAFADYPRVPLAKRDIAVVVDESRPAEEVLAVIGDAARGLLAGITLFDVYQGDQIPAGKKSLACAVTLQAPDRTLSEEEIERTMGKIRRALEHRAGAAFRA